MSAGEDALGHILDEAKIPYMREWRFHGLRRWRFDFALGHNEYITERHNQTHLEVKRLAIEVDGQFKGRHRSWADRESDIDKFNQAVLCGWRVLHFTPKMVTDGAALPVILEAWCR